MFADGAEFKLTPIGNYHFKFTSPWSKFPLEIKFFPGDNGEILYLNFLGRVKCKIWLNNWINWKATTFLKPKQVIFYCWKYRNCWKSISPFLHLPLLILKIITWIIGQLHSYDKDKLPLDWYPVVGFCINLKLLILTLGCCLAHFPF